MGESCIRIKVIAVTRNKVKKSCKFFGVEIFLYSHLRLPALCVDFPVNRSFTIQNEISVNALLLDELVVGAVLNNPSVIHH